METCCPYCGSDDTVQNLVSTPSGYFHKGVPISWHCFGCDRNFVPTKKEDERKN